MTLAPSEERYLSPEWILVKARNLYKHENNHREVAVVLKMSGHMGALARVHTGMVFHNLSSLDSNNYFIVPNKQLCFGIERLFQQVIDCCIYIHTQHNTCNTEITHVIDTWTCTNIFKILSRNTRKCVLTKTCLRVSIDMWRRFVHMLMHLRANVNKSYE